MTEVTIRSRKGEVKVLCLRRQVLVGDWITYQGKAWRVLAKTVTLEPRRILAA